MATNISIAREVIAQAEHLGEETEGIFIPDIVKMIPDTIREIVYAIADSGSQGDRKELQKNYTITPITDNPVLDTGDLTAAIAADMYVHLPFSAVMSVLAQGGDDVDVEGELQYVADRTNILYAELSDGSDYYTVEGPTLYIHSQDLLTSVRIRSFFFPTITALPPQFESELTDRLLMKLGMTRKR